MFCCKRSLAAAVVVAVSGVVGCGPPNYRPPAATQPADARAALVVVLEAWKEGASLEALREGPRPIYVGDEDWQAGGKLAHYQITGDGEPAGLNMVYPVVVEMQANGRRQKKAVRYRVTTEPVINIMRSDE